MKKVRKAIIPVAGLGTRFLPITKSIPKEMLPIIDKPTLQYIIEEAVESGIEEILLITRSGKSAIENHFDSNYELENILLEKNKLKELELINLPKNLCKLFYIRQKEPLGSGHAIKLGQSFINDEPFAVLYGDDLMYSKKEPVLKQLIKMHEKTNANVIGTKEVLKQDVSKYGMIKFKSDNLIETIIEKPELGTEPSLIAGLGRYIVNSTIFDALDKIKQGAGNEYQFTDAMKELMKKEDFYSCNIDGAYYDVGSKFGYLKANIEYALRRDDLKLEIKEYLKKIDE